ncbi:hypothetical protein B0H16DRAFT_245034 [Mycena metata]|uniref:Uncharacterized protein n=1 Tax=Mycena metata TaxID=1033252 RepID=A0AAD7HTK3_9AGAR|nr:hypothetical protein B0H16DRAFT_245034 [Mycena metata]
MKYIKKVPFKKRRCWKGRSSSTRIKTQSSPGKSCRVPLPKPPKYPDRSRRLPETSYPSPTRPGTPPANRLVCAARASVAVRTIPTNASRSRTVHDKWFSSSMESCGDGRRRNHDASITSRRPMKLNQLFIGSAQYTKKLPWRSAAISSFKSRSRSERLLVSPKFRRSLVDACGIHGTKSVSMEDGTVWPWISGERKFMRRRGQTPEQWLSELTKSEHLLKLIFNLRARCTFHSVSTSTAKEKGQK